jgi:hypothetical protein
MGKSKAGQGKDVEGRNIHRKLSWEYLYKRPIWKVVIKFEEY